MAAKKKATKGKASVAETSAVDLIAKIREEAEAAKQAADDKAKAAMNKLSEALREDESQAMQRLREIQDAIRMSGAVPQPYTVPGSLPKSTGRRRAATTSEGKPTRAGRGGGPSLKTRILSYLSKHESVSVEDLTSALGGSEGGIRVALSNLVSKDGLVERPGRGLHSITASGKKALAQSEPAPA